VHLIRSSVSVLSSPRSDAKGSIFSSLICCSPFGFCFHRVMDLVFLCKQVRQFSVLARFIFSFLVRSLETNPVRTASFLGDFFLVPLSRVSVLLFSVEILCAQLGHRHRSELPISSIVNLVRCPSVFCARTSVFLMTSPPDSLHVKSFSRWSPCTNSLCAV
jgi:hypothetical protein